MKQEANLLVSSLKENKFLLIKDTKKEFYHYIGEKVVIKNVATLHYLSRLFSSLDASKLSLQIIERCFQAFVGSASFLELDFNTIAKIMSSSELNIDSELEVFNAVVSWLNYNSERSVHAKNLFSKIRISLLSVPALKLISNKLSCYVDNFFGINEMILQKTKGRHPKFFKSACRFCEQDKYDIIFCEGSKPHDVVCEVYSVKANDFNKVTRLPQLKEGRLWSRVICLKCEIYVFSGVNAHSECVTSIEKYSSVNNSWDVVAHMCDKRIGYSVCSFIGSAYVLGGFIRTFAINSCLKLDRTRWTKVAGMNEPRKDASCAVFEGKIVVTGGLNANGPLKTAEAYDHVADIWTHMPSMIKMRYHHKSFAVKNKLFIVGGCYTETLETYDCFGDKFVTFKSPPKCFSVYTFGNNEVVLVGRKIFVFQRYKKICLTYNLETETWSEEQFELTNHFENFSCVKYQQL